MSWNMYYLPRMEERFYSEDGIDCHGVYSREELLIPEKHQHQEFERVSEINDSTISPHSELTNECRQMGLIHEMEYGLSSHLHLRNSDGIYSSVLRGSCQDSEFDSYEQVVDLPADTFQREESPKTIGHLNVHASEQSFICKICEKRFGSRISLSNHSVIHLEDRPHVCQKCGKSFKRSNNLARHFETHSRKMKYRCEVCKTRFPLKSELTRHVLLVHSAETPHVCHHCGKCFKSETFLSRHMRVHTDGKDFPCDICSKIFQSKKHLAEHMDVHSTEKLHVCECRHCGKSLETSKGPFHSQAIENRTAFTDEMSVQQKMNGKDAEERNTSFSLTSMNETLFHAEPSDNVGHDISTNFEGGCTINVVSMSPKFPITPAVECRPSTPDSGQATAVFECCKAPVPLPTQWEEVNCWPGDSVYPCG